MFVSLDGAKIYGAAYYMYLKESVSLQAKVGNEHADPRSRQLNIDQQLAAQGIAPDWLLTGAAFESLNQSIDDMLASIHPLIRGLAVLDARCGKRRLLKIDTTAEHPFVARLHALRLA